MLCRGSQKIFPEGKRNEEKVKRLLELRRLCVFHLRREVVIHLMVPYS